MRATRKTLYTYSNSMIVSPRGEVVAIKGEACAVRFAHSAVGLRGEGGRRPFGIWTVERERADFKSHDCLAIWLSILMVETKLVVTSGDGLIAHEKRESTKNNPPPTLLPTPPRPLPSPPALLPNPLLPSPSSSPTPLIPPHPLSDPTRLSLGHFLSLVCDTPLVHDVC